MHRPRYLGPLLFVMLSMAPGLVRAQAARADSTERGSLTAERRRLAAELTRVNAEIDTLKRDNRGLRDDYRLRARMADAEALARRLTELDGRLLGGKSPKDGGGATPSVPWAAVPEVRPFDDRGDLEAKADILADQARRLTAQADALESRVNGVRGRQELRRRANQLERDPFSPLEQAKRRLATTGGSKDAVGGPPVSGRPTFETATPGNATPGSAAGSSPPPMGPAIGVGTPTTTPTTPGLGGVTADQSARSNTTGSMAAPFASPLGAPVIDSPGSVASQFRGVLDSTTLAEIRRLEVPGSSAGSLQAMERALSALRARAAELGTSAAALRKRAKAGQ